jgi:anti-sigma B factor antagonist
MHIDEEQRSDQGVTVLHVKGDMWGGDEWSLHKKVEELIENEQKKIVVDLSKVDRINSQGIGVLVACLNVLREAEGDMKIAGANQNISGHLDLLKLYTVLESFPTADDAVASFG